MIMIIELIQYYFDLVQGINPILFLYAHTSLHAYTHIL